ncbi:hypothetical protein, partial [Klebsiella aerogenes]|uniref:hypothetical protein n=1 Tax=Klebsiella aerogenes TaxID=548 RepID=UPI001953CB23
TKTSTGSAAEKEPRVVLLLTVERISKRPLCSGPSIGASLLPEDNKAQEEVNAIRSNIST